MLHLIDQALLDRMAIDESEIDTRKRLMGCRPEDEHLLSEAASVMKPVIGQIVHDFFTLLMHQNEISQFAIGGETYRRLKGEMARYVSSLFGEERGREYVYERLRIGLIHQRNGVEPKLFIAAMKALKAVLRDHISRCMPDKKSGLAVWNALDSLLCFDTMFVLDTYFYSYMSQVDQARSEIETYARSLEEQVAARTRELEEQSRRDSLTGLYNHRAFTEFLRRDLALAIRNGTPLCLVYIDVDDFKIVNDKHGHREGDDLLKQIGSVLASVSRESDIACRYGGDEFCVILPNAFSQQAKIFCERIIDRFTRIRQDVTMSFGIGQSGPVDHLDMDSLIRAADGLMYSAKRISGNHIGIVDA